MINLKTLTKREKALVIYMLSIALKTTPEQQIAKKLFKSFINFYDSVPTLNTYYNEDKYVSLFDACFNQIEEEKKKIYN